LPTDAGELGVYTHEKRFIRKDGALVWAELEASTVNDETGTPLYGIRVVRDITERKHAAEHQRVMMYELDHRVRNTLAIVQSVASHTLRAAGVDRSIATALTDRLIALAGAHAVLSSESWEGGDLDAVVTKVISAHERIRANGPAVRLRPSLIVMLSLVLHELATNAAKYGALSNETGWVDLSWDLAGDRLSLSWRESGGPPAEPPRRRGFGSQLIERLIRAEGGAVLSTRYEPTGAEVDIEVPVVVALPTTAAA
jgi:two-component sensor histidine kinase